MRAQGMPLVISVIVFLFVLARLTGMPPASPVQAGVSAGGPIHLLSDSMAVTDPTGVSPAVLVADKSPKDTSKPAAKPGTAPSTDKDDDEEDEEEEDDEDEDDDKDKDKAAAPAPKQDKKIGRD